LNLIILNKKNENLTSSGKDEKDSDNLDINFNIYDNEKNKKEILKI